MTVAFENDTNEGQLYQWVRKYKILGYKDLANSRRGRPLKNP